MNIKSQTVILLSTADDPAVEANTTNTFVLRPSHTVATVFFEKGKQSNTPAKNQRQRRKNARRAFAAGDKKAFV